MKRLCVLPEIASNFLLCLILLLTAGACKKTTLISPADGTSFPGMGFIFQEDFEPVAADWVYYNTDTVATTVVKMIALDSSAIAYVWTIGSATYNTKEVRLNFPPDYLRLNKQLYVKLTMRYNTTTHTDSVQTFVRQLTFSNPCESKLNGIFKGSTDEAPQTDSFEILTCTHDALHPDNSFYLNNFQQGCGRYFDELPDTYNIGYKQILFSGAANFICNATSGIINIQGDSIRISYRSFDNGMLEAPLDHVFRGVRK